MLETIAILCLVYFGLWYIGTVFENPQKCRIIVSILAFSTIFCPIKIDLSGNTVWPQASIFQKLAKMTIFAFFNHPLSTRNLNVTRFARNDEWDFFLEFQTLWNVYWA